MKTLATKSARKSKTGTATKRHGKTAPRLQKPPGKPMAEWVEQDKIVAELMRSAPGTPAEPSDSGKLCFEKWLRQLKKDMRGPALTKQSAVELVRGQRR